MKEVLSQVENPKKAISRAIGEEYGRYAYIDSFRSKGEEYEISVGFKVPRRFNDLKRGEIYYKHLDFENVAVVYADYRDKSLNIRGPDTEEVSERIGGKIDGLRQNLGQEVVETVADDIIKMPGVLNDFSKVKKLVRIFKRDTTVDLGSFLANEGDSAIKYVELLEDLEYIDRVGDTKWREGKKLRQTLKDHENNAYKEVIKEIICNRPHEMQRELGLQNVVPYIEILELYYFVRYQAGSDVDLSVSQLKDLYQKHYNKRKPEYYIEDKLLDLREQDVVSFDGDFVTPGEGIEEEVNSLSTA